MRILVSACLLGLYCRYDGQKSLCDKLLQLKEEHELIPVCPEQLGGFMTPREPAERKGDKVQNRIGEDVTAQYEQGARETLALAKMLDCDMAILKHRSPSCGSSLIYDGTFSGKKIPGMGVTTELLRKNGIKVISEEEIDQFFS